MDEFEFIQIKNVSCDTIRKKINMFLATKEMTLTAFLERIGGVNSNSYGRFMKLKGSHSGRDNGTYLGAAEFFAKRDEENKIAKKALKAAGKVDKTLSKRKMSSVDDGEDNVGAKKVCSHEEVLPSSAVDVAEIVEESCVHTGPVFDDCDEVRRKIAVCIQSPSMNQSKFSKLIGLTPGT